MSALSKKFTANSRANLALLIAAVQGDLLPQEFIDAVEVFVRHYAGWPQGFAREMAERTLLDNGFAYWARPDDGSRGGPTIYDGAELLACLCEKAPEPLRAVLLGPPPEPDQPPPSVQKQSAVDRRAAFLRRVAEAEAKWMELIGADPRTGCRISALSLDTLVSRIEINLPEFKGLSEATIARAVRKSIVTKHGLAGDTCKKHKGQK